MGKPGRPKGAQNKVTRDFKEALTKLLNAQNLKQLLASVPDERKLDTLAKLAEYVFPKQARTEVTGEGGGPLRVIEIVREDQPP